MPDPTLPALARDRLMYIPAGGTPIEFVPADSRALVADREVERISVHRPGGRVGEWVRAVATTPAVPPPPPPPAPVPASPAPVVEPPVATPPVAPPPAFRRMVVAEDDPRDEAVRVNARTAGELVVRDLLVDGYEDGVVVERTGGRDVVVENVRVLNTWRTAPDRAFKGQGIYLDGCGAVTVRGYLGHRLGWQPGRPPHERNNFRHGVYSNFAVRSLLIEDSWIDEAACAGIQARGPAVVRRCLISECAVALLLLGGATIEEVTVYGGRHRYSPPEPADPAAGKPARPASWTGNVAVSVYHPTTLRDVWVVGRTGQGESCDLIPGLRTNHIGAVVGSGSYSKPEWQPPRDAAGNVVRDLMTAVHCRIVGWPGPAFAGDRPHGGGGFVVDGVAVDVRSQLDALRAEAVAAATTAEMAAIVARGQRLVREAAARTFAT